MSVKLRAGHRIFVFSEYIDRKSSIFPGYYTERTERIPEVAAVS